MEILIRYFGDNHYVWKQAEWHDGSYYTTNENEESIRINENRILAIKDDSRIGYVTCRHCGALVENTPEAIEKHFAESEAKKNCMKCDYMQIYDSKRGADRSFEPQEDGYYKVTETFLSRLSCDAGYWGTIIGNGKENDICVYYQCRRKGVQEIQSVFLEYPNLFEKQVTVDTLNAKKYEYEGYANGFFKYDMKLRGTLKACVNELGIIDSFIYIRSCWSYRIYYSDKYKKLFYDDCGVYKEDITYIMSAQKSRQIIAKISELYKEANGNDQK